MIVLRMNPNLYPFSENLSGECSVIQIHETVLQIHDWTDDHESQEISQLGSHPHQQCLMSSNANDLSEQTSLCTAVVYWLPYDAPVVVQG